MGDIDGDVAGPLQDMPVDHHVAGDQQARPALAPLAIQAFVQRRGPQEIIAETFGHGGLAQPVRQHRAAGQNERLCQQIHFYS